MSGLEGVSAIMISDRAGRHQQNYSKIARGIRGIAGNPVFLFPAVLFRFNGRRKLVREKAVPVQLGLFVWLYHTQGSAVLMRFPHDPFTVVASESEDFHEGPYHIFHAVDVVIVKQNLVAGNTGNGMINKYPWLGYWLCFHTVEQVREQFFYFCMDRKEDRAMAVACQVTPFLNFVISDFAAIMVLKIGTRYHQSRISTTMVLERTTHKGGRK